MTRGQRAGALCALAGLVGSILVSLTTLAAVTGIFPVPSWADPLDLLIIIGLIPGFLSFAIAVLRTDLFPRRLGFLLTAPAVIFAVNFVRGLTLGRWTPLWAPFLLGAAQALAHLAIGFVLYNKAGQEEQRGKKPEVQMA